MKKIHDRRSQLLAINNILREQSISLSRMHLFDRNDKKRQSENMKNSYAYGQLPQAPKYKQQSQNKKIREKQLISSPINNKGLTKREADLEDMELSPISRISMGKKKSSVPETLPKVSNSRLSKSKLISTFTSSQFLNPELNQNYKAQLLSEKKSITSISFKSVKEYFELNLNFFQQKLSPEKIYNILNPLFIKNQINLEIPLIKQYRNCIYFGQTVQADQKHEGFLIFFSQKKIYYGQLINEKKNGRGTEVNFQNDSIFMGVFLNGKKKGKFTVIKPHEKYQGELKNDCYEGYGRLYTKNSIYTGSFSQGCRHGQGEENFLQTGLTISGTFIYNRFTNDQNKIQESRVGIKNGMKSRYKPNMIMDQSAHSFMQYQYDLKTKGPQSKQNKWNKFNSSRFRVKKGDNKRRKTIQEEDPLDKRVI